MIQQGCYYLDMGLGKTFVGQKRKMKQLGTDLNIGLSKVLIPNMD